MLRLLVMSCLVISAQATIIDRLAITVGRQVITESQLDEELRVTAFLNRRPISRGADERRAAADRLVAQLLVEGEMQLSHYPFPDANDINNYLEQVKAGFDGESRFDEALAADDLTEATLRQHLALQLTTLRFIEYRFRPDVGISDSDIESYYDRETAAWRAGHPGAAPPTLAQSKESIRKTLVQERTDEALDTWLEKSRKRVDIVYLDKSLQ